MGAEPECIFCGIVAGEVESTRIAENERAIAFMDINPVTPGHALVVPRSHATDLFDVSADDLAACAQLAQQVADRAKDRLGADGVNLLNCSGEVFDTGVSGPSATLCGVEVPAATVFQSGGPALRLLVIICRQAPVKPKAA